jgi:hypothetical protein
MAQADTNRRIVSEAVEAGWGARDISAVAEYLRAIDGDHGP